MVASTTVTRTVPLLDLKAQFIPIAAEVQAAVARVIESQRFIMGPDVAELEKEIAAYTHVQYAVACGSGSDALFLALLGLGVAPGDEILTTPYTFFATAGAIHRAGARPVFADIDLGTFNLDPEAVRRTLDAHPRVKAIIPVHLFGACADMDPLLALAKERGIAVIEDAAQAIGAEMNDRRAGAIGDVACFSFFPSKNLGAFGEGGILTTNNPELAGKLAALRVHGEKTRYYHQYVGVNSRLDTLQAAVLRVKLKYLDGWTAGRQRNADQYRERFAQKGVPVTLPALHGSTSRHIYNQFVIRGARRDQLQAYLAEHGIGTAIYYPLSLHLQECFAYLGYKQGDFPNSEEAAATSLALPIYPELTTADLDYVVDTIAAFYAG
jgi:dTDP-4-amino-4,6-dideoxygalactose transaminase